jgi:hypothetical protein
MTTALDSFRDPPPQIDLLAQTPVAVNPLCMGAIPDVEGNTAFFNNICVTGTINSSPFQAQPPKAFMGRLFDTTGTGQVCPAGVWTRVQFDQFQITDTPHFQAQPVGGPHYDRIYLSPYTLPDLVVDVFINIAGAGPTNLLLGIIDDLNNIDVAIATQASIGFAGSITYIVATSSTIGLAVNPTGTPLTITSINWPAFQVVALGQL